MIKILIGNENATDNSELSQFLANDKKYIIENTYDGKSTLSKYIETKPDILILDSNFSDLNYIEIIDRISSLPDKKYPNNIILILHNSEEVFRLKNYTKIFNILKSDYRFEDIEKIVNSLSLKLKKPILTVAELNIYLSQLCFAPRSQCTDYTRTAILHCYEHPESQTSLQNIYKIVAKVYDKVVVLDLRDEEIIHAGNRFMIYALYPETQISVHVAWGFRKQNTAVMIGKSIVNRSSDFDIGALCLKYGGGGHKNAGTCQLENDEVDEKLPDIIAELNS